MYHTPYLRFNVTMKKPIVASALLAFTIFGAININVQPASAAYSRCTGVNRGSYCFRVGNRGPLVYALIEDLRCAGYYYVRNDSYYGPVAQRAVANFQRDYGLYADGVAGPQTRNLIRQRCARGY